MKNISLYILIFSVFISGVFLYSTHNASSQTTVEISNLRTENVTDTGAEIWWDTNDLADTNAVYYDTVSGITTGDVASYNNCSPNGGMNDTIHCIYLSGLSPGTEYFYKAEVYVSGGTLIQSSEQSFLTSGSSSSSTTTTTTSAPSAPSNLTAIVSSADIYLTWQDNSGNEEMFNIYRSTDGTNFGTSITSLDANITNYTDTGLTDGTYYYKVKACNINGCSESNIKSATVNTSTNTGESSGSTPEAPLDLTATPSTDQTQVFLSWTDKSSNEEQFQIYRALSGSTFSLLSTVGANSTSYTDNQITEGNSYNYGVSACNTYGCSSKAMIYDVVIGSTGSTTDSTLNETKTISGTVKYSDGSAVTNAFVEAYQASTGKWHQTQTGSNGSYAFNVIGGNWEVYIYPSTDNADWSYNKEPKKVSFNTDNSTEAKTLNFTVSLVDAKITGYVLLPDGSAPPSGTVFISFNSSEFSYGGEVGSNGYFSVSVQEGSYSIYVHSESTSYSAPELSAVSVNTGEVKDIGTVYLLENTSSISGKVTDSSGAGVSGIEINAWQPEGTGYTHTTTDLSGFYVLSVSKGTWEVHPELSSATDLQTSEPPKRVDVSADSTVSEVDFTLVDTDATLTGTIVDTNGNPLADAYGWAGLGKSDGTESGYGAPIENGKFTIKAPSGDYELFIHFPPDSRYVQLEPISVSLKPDSSSIIDVAVAKTSSVVSGYLINEFGSIVKGVEARVFATTGGGIWQETVVDSATGQYKLRASEGTWYLGYEVEADSDYISSDRPNIKVSVTGSSVTQDIILKRADARIQGVVRDPDGSGVPGVYVGVSKISFKEAANSEEHKDPIVAGAKTDSSGYYSINVPAGEYYIKTFVGHLTGWLAAAEQKVTLNPGQTQNIDFKLRRPSVKIRGSVYRKLDAVPNAFVWAWSETGGFQTTQTDSNGKYEISATPNEEWVIAASKDINGELFRSEEVPVFVGEEDIARILEVTRVGVFPESQTKTTDSTETTVVKTDDGTTVTVPANSILTSGSVSVSISPDSRVTSQGSTKVVGIAYKLAARDSSGQQITNFKSDVTVTIPYKDLDLSRLGIDENKLSFGFWDEASGVWRTKDSYAVNTDKDVVTGTTNHFTRFALLTVVPTVDTSGIADGDLIKTADNPDVYIAKKVGNKRFKRLILNPDIFNAYGHLTWDSIKTVTQAQMDAFVLSGLTVEVYPDGTPVNGKVYQVSSDAGTDVGVSRWVNMPAEAFEAAGFDWDSIYQINEFEASPDFYPAGEPITSV
ncbi:MAG: carboxypeptidase regulatory-like domain-containing protein [Candidatus Spechtbacterales bacterium]|nr:carboxypeptidase regulatory-like domain-containing protein [Candidatus Spechtbacterales bacterium]